MVDIPDVMMFLLPVKDPEERLPYIFDWAGQNNNNGLTNWLEEGSTIVDYTITVPPGITLERDELIFDSTAILVDISGGLDGSTYEIECKITTSSTPPIIAKRTAILPVSLR